MRMAFCDDEPLCLAQVMEIAEEYVRDHPDKRLSLHPFAHTEDLLD